MHVIKVDKSAIDQLLAFDDDDDDEEESEEDDAEVRRHRRDFDGRMERALFLKRSILTRHRIDVML